METMTAELVPAGDSALAQAQAGPVLRVLAGHLGVALPAGF